MKIQLFGERVLFEPVEEELKGSIVLPEKANKNYELGRVLLIGNGKTKGADGSIKEVPIHVQPGDIVWFQINPMMAANSAVRFKGKTYLQVLQHDLIGKLKSTTVSLENFSILGHWILIDTFEDRIPGSQIHLPDTVQDQSVRMLRYFVVQKGENVKDFEIGDEVIIEKRAAQLVAFNDEPYFYLDSRHVHGVVETTPELEKAKKDKAELAKAKKREDERGGGRVIKTTK
jgi:co-chaperonin GroES (HSP10)